MLLFNRKQNNNKKVENMCNTTQPTQHFATLEQILRTVLVFHSTFKIFGLRLRNLAPPNRTLTPRSHFSLHFVSFWTVVTETRHTKQNTTQWVSLHKRDQKKTTKK